MRILLSTIGSRGDVQPLLALALALRAAGIEVRLCVPPDFRDWLEGLGFSVTCVGPELRQLTAGKSGTGAPMFTREQRQQLAEMTVKAQFEAVAPAAQGCDLLVAATALQLAARSVAEQLGIGYVFVGFCPIVFPSAQHAPPPMQMPSQTQLPERADNSQLWEVDKLRWNETFAATLNAQRASRGLSPVSDVRSHIFGERPWLAADRALGPWPEPGEEQVRQTGAWLVPDERPLERDLERFLDAGEPPVSFGFGSIRATPDLGRIMIESARALGRRAIVSRGWAELALLDDQPDCLAIGEVNQQALFRRVAAVVHHGGAGTTTAAASSGAAQVVVPQMYDQHYWASRVQQLGIGAAHAAGAPTTGSLTSALDQALRAEVRDAAQRFAPRVERTGARLAAEQLAATWR